MTYKHLLPLLLATFTLLLSTVSFAKDYSDYKSDCEPIKETVEHILDEYGISRDYFYLLVAESHCQNKTSKYGAKSVWQLMPATAKKYGCDNLDDLVCATNAAAKYLKHLEEKCGKENTIYCWHDGGSNFLYKHNSIPTNRAKGLKWQANHFKLSNSK